MYAYVRCVDVVGLTCQVTFSRRCGTLMVDHHRYSVPKSLAQQPETTMAATLAKRHMHMRSILGNRCRLKTFGIPFNEPPFTARR